MLLHRALAQQDHPVRDTTNDAEVVRDEEIVLLLVSAFVVVLNEMAMGLFAVGTAIAAIAESRDPVHERPLREVTADMQVDDDLAPQPQDRRFSPQLRAQSERRMHARPSFTLRGGHSAGSTSAPSIRVGTIA